MPKKPSTRPENLKEAAIDEAFDIIARHGVEKLSLREVARRLGVSHQAPYKHFPSRDHILAAVVSRCYREFAQHMETCSTADDTFEGLRSIGTAYLTFAREHPLKYRLMFGSPLPPLGEHPDMVAEAAKAFGLLKHKLERLPVVPTGVAETNRATHDAVYVWATIHGIASLMQSDALGTLNLTPTERDTALANAMARIGFALAPHQAEPPAEPANAQKMGPARTTAVQPKGPNSPLSDDDTVS